MNIYYVALVVIIFVLWGFFLVAKEAPVNKINSADSTNKNNKTKYSADDIAWENLPDEFVIFDLETTGLKSNKIPVDIVEISAIKIKSKELRAGGDVETFTSIVKPVRGGINPEAAAINGITQRMVDREGEELEKTLHEFIEFVGDRLLVAYNVNFDRWFLQRELAEYGIKKRFKYECAYQLAKHAFPNLHNYKLTTVATKLGIDTNGAHRALADCVMTMHVYIWAKTFTKDGGDIFDTFLPFTAKNKPELQGVCVAFTGVFEGITREQAERLAEIAGMTVKAAISKKVNFLVVGSDAGGKLDKANLLGIETIDESKFIEIIS